MPSSLSKNEQEPWFLAEFIGIDGRVCVLCGHTMTFEACGAAGTLEGSLCHHDSHDCYTKWTVYGERPE